MCLMRDPGLRPIIKVMLSTGSGIIDAERAFARVTRERRRAALLSVLRRQPSECGRLPVFDELRSALERVARRGCRREIPLCQIRGTLEPSRAAQFDPDFRPAPIARSRWQRTTACRSRAPAAR